ncbi:MAG: hypothetical protein ABIE70_11985 [bacterium]
MDASDNCPFDFNPDQADSNSDGIGDACDCLCGDVNHDGSGPDQADLDAMVDYLIYGGAVPEIAEAANTGGCGGLNIHDLAYWTSHLVGPFPQVCHANSGCSDCPTPVWGLVTLDSIEGMYSDSTIETGSTVSFQLRFSNNRPTHVVGVANAFSVFSTTGAAWGTTTIAVTSALSNCFDFIVDTVAWSTDGILADTVGYVASDGYQKMGLPPGFSEVSLVITIGPIADDVARTKICLDIAKDLPCGPWLWSDGSEITGPSIPDWDGPHCFTVIDCCHTRGDINHDGTGPDIADLVHLVNYMFNGGPNPPCMREADINGDDSGPDIADLVSLVNYMFNGGPPPPACPM